MRVHNVYSDLLLGLSRFINNKVLHGRPVEHWQLNIGDSGLQLDYEQGYSLPAGIINLENIVPYNNKPYVFQHRSGNIHCIQVLYNHSKDLPLVIQEEQFTLNTSLLINCSNHMQALDIQHQLLSYLPVQKYMHFYEFACFLEIDDFLVNQWLFDVDNDTIENLFIKHNKYTDSIDYSFALTIQPLLRFNDFTIQLSPDTNQETFQVSSSIEYLVTVPIYLHYPKFNIHAELGPETININRSNIISPVSLTREYRKLTMSSVEPNDRFFKDINISSSLDIDQFNSNNPNSPIYNDFENPNNLNPLNYNYEYNVSNYEFNSAAKFIGKDNETVIGELKGIYAGEITEFDFETIINNKVGIGSGYFFNDFEKNEISGKIEGHTTNGYISEIKLDPNGKDNFTCLFNGTIDVNKQINNKDIFIEYTITNKSKKIKNIRTIFKDSPYILIDNKNINTRNIYDAVGNINPKRTTVNLSKTSIKELTLRSVTPPYNELKFEFSESLFFREDGVINKTFSIPGIDNNNQYQENYLNSFIFKFPYGITIYDFLPEGNYELFIHLNKRTGKIETVRFEDRDNPNIVLDYDVDFILFDNINFELVPDIAGTTIDRINVDLAWNEGSMITDHIPVSIDHYYKYNKTIIVSELYNLTRFTENNNKVIKWKFDIKIKGIPHIPSDINDIMWKIVYPNKELTTTGERDEIELDIDGSSNESLTFIVSNDWYYKYFKDVSKTNIIFFSIGQKK